MSYYLPWLEKVDGAHGGQIWSKEQCVVVWIGESTANVRDRLDKTASMQRGYGAGRPPWEASLERPDSWRLCWLVLVRNVGVATRGWKKSTVIRINWWSRREMLAARKLLGMRQRETCQVGLAVVSACPPMLTEPSRCLSQEFHRYDRHRGTLMASVFFCKHVWIWYSVPWVFYSCWSRQNASQSSLSSGYKVLHLLLSGSKQKRQKLRLVMMMVMPPGPVRSIYHVWYIQKTPFFVHMLSDTW